MKAKDIIAQAQTLSGVGSFGGVAVDVDGAATANAVFKQTMNQINNDSKLNLVQSRWNFPLPASNSYSLPDNCRRVLKCIAGNADLRKTDFAEIERSRATSAFVNMYAVNNRRLELVIPSTALIIYVKEYGDYQMDDEVDMPQESLDYVINLLAYNLALSFRTAFMDSCQVMAEKSYNALLSNLRTNEGAKYQSSQVAFARFSGSHAGAVI